MSYTRITVVTPNFNGAATLEATLQSVFDQSYPNLEYIVVDGGSHDGSVDIIRKHARRLTHWESGPDRGQAHALNKGFARATGEIWGFVNSDDLLSPRSLHAIAEAHRGAPGADLIQGACDIADAAGNVLRVHRGRIDNLEQCLDLYGVWWNQRQFIQPEVFWTANLARRVGPFDETLHIAFDYEFWLRAFAQRARITQTTATLAVHRRHPAQKTADGQRVRDELVRLARTWVARPETPLSRWERLRLRSQFEFVEDVAPKIAAVGRRSDRWRQMVGSVCRRPSLLLAPALWQRTRATVRTSDS